jgi:hypothetical protein
MHRFGKTPQKQILPPTSSSCSSNLHETHHRPRTRSPIPCLTPRGLNRWAMVTWGMSRGFWSGSCDWRPQKVDLGWDRSEPNAQIPIELVVGAEEAQSEHSVLT